MSTYTGDIIRKYRTEKGLTQKKLGELCGIADSAIRRYEAGNANPKIETLQKIADALGVPVNRFLARSIVIPVAKPTPELIKELQQEEKELAFLNTMDSLREKLNDKGQEKAIEQVELLTKIPAYRANIDISKDFYFRIDNDGNLIEVDKPIENQEKNALTSEENTNNLEE